MDTQAFEARPGHKRAAWIGSFGLTMRFGIAGREPSASGWGGPVRARNRSLRVAVAAMSPLAVLARLATRAYRRLRPSRVERERHRAAKAAARDAAEISGEDR